MYRKRIFHTDIHTLWNSAIAQNKMTDLMWESTLQSPQVLTDSEYMCGNQEVLSWSYTFLYLILGYIHHF